jgi:hypothetical protein
MRIQVDDPSCRFTDLARPARGVEPSPARAFQHLTLRYRLHVLPFASLSFFFLTRITHSLADTHHIIRCRFSSSSFSSRLPGYLLSFTITGTCHHHHHLGESHRC